MTSKNNGYNVKTKNVENGTDRGKIRREKILVYKKVHEFSLFRNFASRCPLYTFFMQ